MSIQLPGLIPEFFDANNLSHSFKQYNKDENYKKIHRRPPKLYPKHDISLNRSSQNNEVHTISFRNPTTPMSRLTGSSRSILTTSTPKTKSCSGSNDSLLNSRYDRNKQQTYYEQVFKPVKKIGEGSFAEVIKVKSKVDNKLYAIKRTKYAYRSEAYRTERLEEVKRLEEFSDHPHCVTLFEAWEQNDILYMQLELCKDSLENYACELKFVPEPMVWSVMLDLLLALKSLHDKNLIHLDIKLENILITEDNVCKLADFGLVFDLNSGDCSRAIEGDSRYVAPELMSDNFCKANDIFSLGIAMLELACNLQLPANGILWQQLRNGVFPDDIMKCISKELQDVIKWMMSPNREDRPTVETLLELPRIQKIIRQRRVWDKFKSVIELKKGISNLFSKVKMFLLLFFVMIKNFFILRYDKNNFNNCIYKQSPKTKMQINIYQPDEDSDEDNFTSSSLRNISKISKGTVDDGDNNNNSSNVTPTMNASIPRVTYSDIKIINSTPLNHDGHIGKNLKKDLSRSCFELGDFSPETSARNLNGSIQETSSVICKKLVFPDDDFDDSP